MKLKRRLDKIPKLTIPKRSVSFWVTILLCLAAGGSLYFALNQLYLPAGVVVPNKVIEERTLITEKDVEVKQVSKRDIHPSAAVNPRQIIGKYTNDRLYPGEQILAQRLTTEPGEITGAFSSLNADETYITFTASEIKWPKGVRLGDRLTAIAVIDNVTVKVGEGLKIIGVDDQVSDLMGQVKQVAAPGTSSSKTLTIALKYNQIGPLLSGKSRAKELNLIPEHPDKEPGGELYELPPKAEGLSKDGKDKSTR